MQKQLSSKNNYGEITENKQHSNNNMLYIDIICFFPGYMMIFMFESNEKSQVLYFWW